MCIIHFLKPCWKSMSEPDRHQLGHYHHISEWFPLLGPAHTFDTKILDLSLEEGQALVKVREIGRMLGQMWNMSETEEDKKRVREMDPRDQLERNHPNLALALKEATLRVDEVIKGFPQGAFVRMNTRSPKDGALLRGLALQLIKEAIEASPQEDPDSLECAAADGIIYWSCTSRACRVRSGEEAIELLSSSNRVQADLSLGFLAHGQSLPVVIREWEDIHPEYEFRVFVVHNQVTAITQYHAALYVREMVENKERVIELILLEFEAVKGKLRAPGDTYTIDFVICPDFSRARVIEVNNPPPVAGTALFNWEDENDRRLIQEGPLSVRMTESPVPWKEQQTTSSMHQPIVQYIDQLRGRVASPPTTLPPPEATCTLI
jgi:hypothetical protein